MTKRAFVLADAVMGIAILAVLTTIVGVEIFSRVSAEKRMENQRAAVAEAELVLLKLHAGQSTNIPDTSKEVRLENATGGAGVPGYLWVRVIVTRSDQKASLVGLAKLNMGGAK